MKKTKRVGFRLDQELYKRLKKVARKRKMTVSNIIINSLISTIDFWEAYIKISPCKKGTNKP